MQTVATRSDLIESAFAPSAAIGSDIPSSFASVARSSRVSVSTIAGAALGAASA